MSRQGQTRIAQSSPVFPAGAAEEREHLYPFIKARVAQNNVIQSMRNPWIKLEAKLVDIFSRAPWIDEFTLSGEGNRAQENLQEEKSSPVLKSCLVDVTPKLPARTQPKKLNLCRFEKRNYHDDDYGGEDDEDVENAPKKMKIKGNGINGTLSSDSGRESLEEDKWIISSTIVDRVLSSFDINMKLVIDN